jgi:hypothetical protein
MLTVIDTFIVITLENRFMVNHLRQVRVSHRLNNDITHVNTNTHYPFQHTHTTKMKIDTHTYSL